MKKVTAFVFAGVRTSGLSVLTTSRSVSAVPIGGKYRVVDFTLSNCINSEITSVYLLAQYKPRSLAKHIGRGEPWDLNRRGRGVGILQPYERQEGRRWFEGTADAMRQNLDVLENSGCDHVLVLPAELIYKMDYSWLFEAHISTGAKATCVVGRGSKNRSAEYGALELDEALGVRAYVEHPDNMENEDVFLGMYLFDAGYLKEVLRARPGPSLFLDCLQPDIGQPFIKGYRYLGDWEAILNLDDYLRANQNLLAAPPRPDLYDPAWRIYTRSEEREPAWLAPESVVTDSLVCNGASILGTVERSIISPGVVIKPGAAVRDSVILNDAMVESGSVVCRSVLDKHVHIGAGARVGSDDPNQALTAAGEWGRIPPSSVVSAGTTVAPRKPELHELISAGMNLP